jgi:hypothetical protein
VDNLQTIAQSAFKGIADAEGWGATGYGAEKPIVDLSHVLDRYDRQARLYPVLFTLLPVGLGGIDLMEGVVHLQVIEGAVLLGAALVPIFFLTDLTRIRGQQAGQHLVQLWGGWPASSWLRLRDDHLSAPTKMRYRTTLKRLGAVEHLPSGDEECADPTSADIIYQSAVDWLREKVVSLNGI